MKKIKTIEVEVSRTIVLNNLNMPDNVYNGINKLHDAGKWIDYNDDESLEALEWLENNIDEYKTIGTEEEFEVKDVEL